MTGRLTAGQLSQLRHRARWVGQQLARPELAVVGGYHYGNLGDMALGAAALRAGRPRFRRVGLQTIYNLHQWPRAPFAMVGGGAVAYDGPMRRVRDRYGTEPANVALAGVDFNDPDVVIEQREFLRSAAYVSCRSEAQAEFLSDVLDRRVATHPDLVFSLGRAPRVPNSDRSGTKTLGVNLVPLLTRRVGSEWVAGSHFAHETAREHASIADRIGEAGERYALVMRDIVALALADGWEVVHVPFTPLDDVYARHALAPLGNRVRFSRYTGRWQHARRVIQRCDRMVSTRYHALILSLVDAVPVTPVLYASKCDRLLHDLSIDTSRGISLPSLFDAGTAAAAWTGDAVGISTEVAADLSTRARSALSNAVTALGNAPSAVSETIDTTEDDR